MKLRFLSALCVLGVLTFVATNYFFSAKAENQKSNRAQTNVAQTKNDDKSTNLIEIKKPTEEQKAIPDEIAYEVFLRTVGENNAPQLLVQAGFDEDKDSEKIRADYKRGKIC